MRVGFFQFQPLFGQVAANLDRIEAALAGARADLIVLPELATTGYNFVSREEVAELAEPAPDGPTVARLAKLARREGFSLVVGMAERGVAGGVAGSGPPAGVGAASGGAAGNRGASRAGVAGAGGAAPFADGLRLYNSAVLVTPDGGPVGLYRKVHLFDREKLVFDDGDLGFPVFTLPGADALKVGVMVCFDWRFPESARSLALAGAELIAHPSNLVKPWCQQAMVTRSLENLVFSITANRTGEEDRGDHPIGFTGRSQVLDPQGRVLASADEDEEALTIVTIDPAAARSKRTNDRNDLFGDRRPELYRLG